MNKVWLQKVYIFAFLMWTSWAAYGISLNHDGLARVCVVDGQLISELQPPDFSSKHCKTQLLTTLDPQNNLLWVAVDLDLNVKTLHAIQPVGLFLSGKTSSQIYFNGQLIGSNGHPALDAKNEQAGLMDAVFHIPIEYIKPTNNQLILLLSAHHGLLQLSQPINSISLNTFQQPNDAILRYYWPSFLPFGVLLLGFFYLTLASILNQLPKYVLLLPLMALLAATQLFLEVSRGLFAYPYPWHDYRLLLILYCSIGYGLSLLAYVLNLLSIKKHFYHWLFHAVLLVTLIQGIPGFDYKSIFAIVFPVTLALIYLSQAWYSGQSHVRFVTLLLLGFFLMVFVNAFIFIDILYYYFVALLVFLLMTQQAKLYKKLQLKYQARTDQLQHIIDQKNMVDSTHKMEIRSSGKISWVTVKDIAYCKGAGDYVELVMANKEVKLFHGSMTELSARLPSIFLKTHRSYLVNTTLITALERCSSGTGQLLLNQGETVPVSKRIMPQVREKLN